MEARCRLQFKQVGELIAAKFEGRRLARSSAAALFRLLLGAVERAPLDGTVLRIVFRDGDVAIDVFRDAPDRGSMERLRTVRGGEASAIYWLLYSPGKDPLLPVTIEVLAQGGPYPEAERE